MPLVFLDGEGNAVIVRYCPAIQLIHAADPRVWRGCWKAAKTKTVQGGIENDAVIPVVADVIGGDDGACSERMLYFKIPLHVLRILEVAADIIHVWNGKGALRVEATSKRLRCARVASAARTARRQTSAAFVIRQKGAIALRHQVHAAAWKCSGCRGRQVERHASRGHVEQVHLREIRIKQAQKTAGVKVGEEAHAPADDRILTDGAPGKAEPWLEYHLFDPRNNRLVAGYERFIVGNRRSVRQIVKRRNGQARAAGLAYAARVAVGPQRHRQL